ncbi:MAG TPA: DUF2255 family protein [Deltaproteobacteria bacterium]|nr:DUF2255 family protein [Deltaproteobacteria bacterium]
MIFRTLAVATLFFLVGCGPMLVLPGGRLSGTPAPAPSDWEWTDEVSTIQLETRPEDPYSVNIWAIGLGDRLYVHAGRNRSRWVENMEKDPSVRVAIDGRIYDLVAFRVREQEEFDAFANHYEEKYGVRPRHEDIAEVHLYRLSAR